MRLPTPFRQPMRLARTLERCDMTTNSERPLTPVQISPIEDIVADLRAGRIVIMVDDEDRENEGDFIISARFATPEVINFMALH